MDVIRAMKGRGEAVAAIVQGSSVLLLIHYPDGSWEIDRDGRVLGLWEPHERERCLAELLALVSHHVHAHDEVDVADDGLSARHNYSATASRIQANHRPTVRSRAGDVFRILLVEDHVYSARATSKLLKSFGYDTEIAYSAAEAMERAAESPFNMVLCDIGLPDGSGCDLMRQFRSRFGLTGVAVTGYSGDTLVQEARKSGFRELLFKPIDVLKLREAIQHTLQASEGQADASFEPN